MTEADEFGPGGLYVDSPHAQILEFVTSRMERAKKRHHPTCEVFTFQQGGSGAMSTHYIPRRDWVDMGMPDVITVTVTPGEVKTEGK